MYDMQFQQIVFHPLIFVYFLNYALVLRATNRGHGSSPVLAIQSVIRWQLYIFIGP